MSGRPGLSFRKNGGSGGFGVGDAADLSWGLTGVLGYRLEESTTLGFGYRYYDVGFTGGELDLDIQFDGPTVGLAFRW